MSFAKQTKEDASSGGGLVGKILIEYGFKVFANGLTQREAFFDFDYNDAKARARAKIAAAALAKKHGVKAPSQPAVQFVIYRTTVASGKAKSWKSDRYFATEVWTDDYLQIVQPHLERLKVEPGEVWGRLNFKPNTRGKLSKEPNPKTGEREIELIAYLSEVFPDEAAAYAAAGVAPEGNGPAVPEPEFNLAFWATVKPEITEKYQRVYEQLADVPTIEERIHRAYAATAAMFPPLTAEQVEQIIHYNGV